VWRDPATPTYAQKADAVVKLHASGILPTEQAWEDLGYSAVQRDRMRGMQDEALTRMTAMDLHQLSTAQPEPQPDVAPAAGG
jgi:formylglycine-generating enzyme required for sulfatase activity